LTELRTHNKDNFPGKNWFANGITLAESPIRVSGLMWEGDMNTNQVSVSTKLCVMAAGALACTMALGALFPSPAAADDASVRFRGGIGVIPVSSVVNCPQAPAACVTSTPLTPPVTVNLNIVRGVSPAGQIWVIDQLDAKVSANGSIKVDGKGLVLAGGNSAGRPPTYGGVRNRHPDLFSGSAVYPIQYVHGRRNALAQRGFQDQRYALAVSPEPLCQPYAPDPKCREPYVVRGRNLPHRR
jgi:hypothetical protein